MNPRFPAYVQGVGMGIMIGLIPVLGDSITWAVVAIVLALALLTAGYLLERSQRGGAQ